MRRFISLRGPVKELRSDRGTNFVGAVRELGIEGVFKENGPISQYLKNKNICWIFNPPHASHMGGCWERMIGLARKILDAMMLENRPPLTHEVLITLMAEVVRILNDRPFNLCSS